MSAWSTTLFFRHLPLLLKSKRHVVDLLLSNLQIILTLLCLYLGQNCLHLRFLPYLSSEAYSSKYGKYEKLHYCGYPCMWKYTELFLLHMCGPHIWLCLLTFEPNALKQLNSLTTILIFSWLGGPEVTQPTGVRDSGSIPVSGKDFYFCFVDVVFLPFCPKHIICHDIFLFLL